jgi:hypothetical protein
VAGVLRPRLLPCPRYAAPAALLAALLVLPGCSGDAGVSDRRPGGAADSGAGAPATAEPTPLAEVDTTAATVPREPPCTGLPETAVVTALDGPAAAARRWGNGEPARLTERVRDVAHEWGCAFRSADGTVARAWVFVPPLTPTRAAEVARAVVADQGCRPAPDAPPFGAATAARVCREGGAVVAAYSGLFGDAWLSCSLARPRRLVDTPLARDALVAGAGSWCVDVLTAARAD